MNQKPLEERFWSKVQKTNDCWIWTAAKDGHGYGQIVFERKKKLASHVVWFLTFGYFPKDLWVLHKCDNPACIRPDHLFLGTRADNAMDMCRKGRAAVGERHGSYLYPERIARGEKNGTAKLTFVKAEEIRKRFNSEKISMRKLAREYLVTHTVISNILHYRSYTE